jgi:hypothetical protein
MREISCSVTARLARLHRHRKYLTNFDHAALLFSCADLKKFLRKKCNESHTFTKEVPQELAKLLLTMHLYTPPFTKFLHILSVYSWKK